MVFKGETMSGLPMKMGAPEAEALSYHSTDKPGATFTNKTALSPIQIVSEAIPLGMLGIESTSTVIAHAESLWQYPLSEKA